ncbi:MAG: ABC transporter ATP-binding protein [Thermoproteota archaeon]|nr:ABC transporter ATP-binding protein [Thermoproteota archaeon]
MIDAENLTKKFGGITAIDDVTFHVNEGEVFGFLGPNGAGKTTTVRMLCCLISKTGGQARVGGYEIGNDLNSLKIRSIVGFLPDNVGLYEELSAYKNLDFYGRLYERTEEQRKESIERFLRLLGLWEKKDLPVGTFSKGMKQKIALARALIHEPMILFLDKPTVNLDPEAARTVRDFILELKKEKKTIFLNTHNLDEAQRICDKIGILKTRLLKLGTPEQLRELFRSCSKTVIQLEKVNDFIVDAVKSQTSRNALIDGNRLIIDVASGEKENAKFIEAIVSAGGHIQYVTQLSPSLEDIYLKVVKEEI